jgi:hypothetical protein
MNQLPNDALDIVFSHLAARDIARAECACRAFREAGQRADLQIHAVPRTEDALLEWASQRPSKVTRVAMRRLRNVWLSQWAFPRVQSMQALYSRIILGDTFVWPRMLRRLELGRLTRHSHFDPETFRLSSLPETLQSVSLTFDSTWHRVIVDASFDETKIRGSADIIVKHLSNARILTLETHTLISVDSEARGDLVTEARIEVAGTHNPDPALRMLGLGVDLLVFSMPMASIVWSEYDHLDPRVLALDADFVSYDKPGANLQYLELRVDRLATAPVPKHVRVWAEVRGIEIDRSFFD